MGLATIIRKRRLKDRQMRILVLGLDNAGKSTVVSRWLHPEHPIDDIAPTFGFQIHDTCLRTGPDQDECLVTIWDIGGQEAIRAFWRSYYEGETDAVCFVVDASDRARFPMAKAELEKVLCGAEPGEEDIHPAQPCASVLILANKQDVLGAASAEEISDLLRLDMFSRGRHDMHVMGCSARQSPDSCTAGLHWISDSVCKRRGITAH